MRHLVPRALVLGALAALALLPACSDDRVEMSSSAGAGGNASAETSAPATPAGLSRADFAVEGMTCGGCVLGARMALKRLDGVQQADASYDDTTGTGAAWALYDPARVGPERMMEAIRTLGYRATLVETRDRR